MFPHTALSIEQKSIQMPKSDLTPLHRAKVTSFLAERGSKTFRRQDLASLLYPMTSPRSRPRADALAAVAILEAAKKGDIRREGHLHWVRVDQTRRLKSGRTVPELQTTQQLVLDTKVPSKWAACDLETGEVWMGAEKGWVRPSAVFMSELKSLLSGGS